MALQEHVYLSGKCKWAKGLISPSAFKKYTVKLSLDQASVGVFLELKKKGIQNELHKDEDGYWINLSRPSEINMRGKLIAMMPPIIIDAAGAPWNPAVTIGDDSDLTCKVAVRKWKSPFGSEGVSIRLESVKVDHLVEFSSDNWPEKEAKQIKGLVEHNYSQS